MFRLDEERVVDATLCGGLARYINHSCNPNCVAEIVEVDRDLRIIIFAKRRIQRGEEVNSNVKFCTKYIYWNNIYSWHMITNLTLRTISTKYRVCAVLPIVGSGWTSFVLIFIAISFLSLTFHFYMCMREFSFILVLGDQWCA